MTIQDDEQIAAQAIKSERYDEALRLLLPLAESDSEYALLSLGWIYETGALGQSDKNVARSYYERATARGSAAAYLKLGWLLLESGEEGQAQSAFKAGAELNDDECKSALTRLIDKDNENFAAQAIRSRSYEKAINLLLPLAENKSEYALLSLGWIYETGAIGQSDKNTARSYYERAAAEGSASAYLDLGRLLLDQGDEAQARSAFKTGAERGDIPSMSRLGRMMIEGRGGPNDPVAGCVWLEKAAAQGHIFAQRTLLSIRARNAQSLFEKLSIKMKIASLAKEAAKEALKDSRSDNIR